MLHRQDSIPDTPLGGLPNHAEERIALYSHDTQGLGHIRRNIAIAQALLDHNKARSILLISGTTVGTAFQLPTGIDLITLPAVEKNARGDYQPRSLPLSLAGLVRLRAATIRAALTSFAPHLFIVDKVAAGFQNELLPSLRALHMQKSTRLVLGWRDILDEPIRQRAEWATRGELDVVRRYYDQIWVYGDPAVYNLVTAYELDPAVARRVHFTGYLDRTNQSRDDAPTDSELQDSSRHVLCTLGGGQDGSELARTFLQTHLPDGMHATLLAGPQMPEPAYRELEDLLARHPAAARVTLLRFTATPQTLLARADRVIAMGGYNTVCEVLAAQKPALIVPRVSPRLEQWIRASRLAEQGWLTCLHPRDLTPEALHAWLTAPRVPPASGRPALNFAGLKQVPRLAQRLLRTTKIRQLPTTRAQRVLAR